MMRLLLCLVVLLVGTGNLAGCGQKGPLERPEPATYAVSSDADAPRNN